MKEIKIFNFKKFKDKRGYFFELYNKKKNKIKKLKQVNISQSSRNVIRGLHYQKKNPQDKFVTVLNGKIFDVCVDLRKKSKNFGKYKIIKLDSKKNQSLYVPVGFAHGFMALSQNTIVCYLTSDFYNPKSEKTILWNDPLLNIKWPNSLKKIISKKDKVGKLFNYKNNYF